MSYHEVDGFNTNIPVLVRRHVYVSAMNEELGARSFNSQDRDELIYSD
jgi:hypothetical protein